MQSTDHTQPTARLTTRLLKATRRLKHTITAPVRGLWARVRSGLARHRQRIIWTLVALAVLSALAGGSVAIYLWRAELAALAIRLRGQLAALWARLRGRAAPVIVVATAPAEEIPAAPVMDGSGP